LLLPAPALLLPAPASAFGPDASSVGTDQHMKWTGGIGSGLGCQEAVREVSQMHLESLFAVLLLSAQVFEDSRLVMPGARLDCH
jgi:hypothetical protein